MAKALNTAAVGTVDALPPENLAVAKFYDPLTERWHPMYEARPAASVTAEPEDVYVRADRLVRQNNIWDAVVSSATSTQITA